jgi:uncharacterized UPF0160 family protein
MSGTAKKIAIGDGAWTADDCVAIYLLQQTSAFSNSTVIRTSDPSLISSADAVVGIGGIYSPPTHRYDHHSPSVDLKFADSAIPLASAGLVYFSHHTEIIETILSR